MGKEVIVKNWIIREQGSDADVSHLQEVLKVERPIANLLVQRGIKTYDEARAFFRPNFSHLHDPFLMKDMDKAVERIDRAMAERKLFYLWRL